jgi:(2Fe-2S) ferredoxin
MAMYEDCLNECDNVPWIITPADQNWYKEYIVASAMHKVLTDFKMKFPQINATK